MKTHRLGRMVRDIWDIGLVLLLVLAALESWQGGFVSRFFNIHIVVLFLAVVSVILLVTRPACPDNRARPYVALQAIGIVSALAVWSVLPEGIRPFWRALAAGGIFLSTLLAWPLINHE